MRIRTQLTAAIVASLILGGVAAWLVVRAAHDENAASETQARAQTASHEVSGLLVLTQEYARHSEGRAAQQWHQRHATIATTLSNEDAGAVLKELRSVTQALPPLFSHLEELPIDESPFTLRRKEVLIDQLLTSTQAMSDLAYQWYQEAAEQRKMAEQRFQTLAVVTPLAMLALLIVVAATVRQRVLGPLRSLTDATGAVSRGDLGVRVAIDSHDEFGELSRRFDHMTLALARSDEQFRCSEQLQAQSEQRVRSILKHAPDAFISIDSQGCIREWNRQAELTLGWTKDEVLGLSLAETLIPPEHRHGHNAGMKQFAATGEGPVVNQRIEITALHKDGHVIPVELSVAAVNEGSGYAATAFLRDISERKRAETLLHDSERRLRDITDNIPAMVGYFDAEERCIYANATVLKIHNIDKKDIRLHTMRSGLGEEIYALHEPHVRRVLQGEFARFEGHLHGGGREAYFQAHLVPDKTDDGTVRGFYVMTFDVTAVRKAERQRARSEKQLRQITDNLPVLISYIDKDQRVRFANETYRTWLGADPSKLLGMHVRDKMGPVPYEARRQYLERALRGERVEFEYEAVALGMTCTRHTSYIPDLEQDGSVQGVYTLSSDVTAIKNVERQLQALARFDTLTGLPNRLQFNEKLPEVLARANRTGGALALMYLDVDHFKSINDTLGHAAGDAVLCEFAARLVSSVRTTDTVARLAGDEFAIILEGLHERSEVQAIAQKIVDHVRSPMQVADRELCITTSVGIAFHDRSQPATTADLLLAKADEALYAAKAAGRGTFRVATPEEEHAP
jgi:diguanylate cyclase (GGDEF)-like protein/PAS domain S-box-containing protein